jgi:hypothetical protein
MPRAALTGSAMLIASGGVAPRKGAVPSETPLSTPEAVLPGDLSHPSDCRRCSGQRSPAELRLWGKLTERGHFVKYWKNSTCEEHDSHRI